MPNVISRLVGSLGDWSFRYNCYEAVHPWTPYCSDCAIDIGTTVFAEAIKLYTPLYLFTQLSQQRVDYQSFQRTAQSILRSTSFISANAFFALFFFCSTKYLTGKFYYYAVAYLPAFLASSMAVLIEKPHRRSSLAFYVANVASDALFRLWMARGYVRPVPNGQVYLFSVAIAIMMYMAKKNGFEDDALSTLIKLVIGSEEASKIRLPKSEQQQHLQGELIANARSCQLIEPKKTGDGVTILISEYGNPSESRLAANDEEEKSISDNGNNSSITQERSTVQSISNFIFSSSHALCPHRNDTSPWHQRSCFLYTLSASARAFSIGYAVQVAAKLIASLPRLRHEPQMALAIMRNPGSMRLAAFIATFSGLFKAFSCSSRWVSNEWRPEQNFLAALLAGPALLFLPSPSISNYVLWKALEALLAESERTQKLSSKTKDSIIVLIYGLATSQLFYTALMNPRYMKKSYMSFLDRMSRHRLHLVNRSVLDVFGTQASAGYEDFFPDLHPKFMSDAFLGSIWIWMIEQKYPFTPIPQFEASIH